LSAIGRASQAEPWPGIPIRKGNRKHKAAGLAAGTWPNLTGKFKPHGDRHTHSTWLDASDVHKVLGMDRRGHARGLPPRTRRRRRKTPTAATAAASP
jgi:integrase